MPQHSCWQVSCELAAFLVPVSLTAASSWRNVSQLHILVYNLLQSTLIDPNQESIFIDYGQITYAHAYYSLFIAAQD